MRGLRALLRRPATGAVTGQATQALAGLLLQVAAARYLGAAGLATFAVIYGAVVLVTAVASGLVGDSLTVLDRAEPGTRAGLHVWGTAVAVVAGLVAGCLAAVTTVVPPLVGVVLGAAVTAFVLEDTFRRLLMAAGRYWSLPVVDGTSLVVSLGVLVLCGLAGPLELAHFLLALVAGQVAAGVVAWWAIPLSERPRGPWRSPDLRGVWSFGIWRAAAQMVRPGLLTGLRLVVVVLAGAAVYGPLEAARVYTAPTLVLVAGLGSYLLPHYVAMRHRSPAAALRSADRAALGLAAVVAVVTGVTLACQPLLEPLLTGGAYDVPVAAVAGWGAYAVSAALLLPYSGLATVHRRQRRVLALRLLEFAPLAGVALLASGSVAALAWAPLLLSAGPVLVAVAVRATVLRPLVPGVAPAPGEIRVSA
ncbi:hypothetical protein DQ237_15600 [Blastococcus sp. TF02-8]|nr:hypothetical protein DQ237_15600 [Blastococcus sp. TF02-8]